MENLKTPRKHRKLLISIIIILSLIFLFLLITLINLGKKQISITHCKNTCEDFGYEYNNFYETKHLHNICICSEKNILKYIFSRIIPKGKREINYTDFIIEVNFE